jgi:Uma2 family endonuclease
VVAARRKALVSEEEYLELELQADHRSEYWDGTIVAMAGSSIAHNQILRNLTHSVSSELRSAQCEQYNSDTRLYSPKCRTYFYPDSQIVCGKANYLKTEAETLLNPTVIIEVLSRSTEGVDRGYKFECYRSISTLQVYILIDQYSLAIDVHTRQEDGAWRETFLRGEDAILKLQACGLALPLSEIYENVEFGGEDEGG